MVTIGKMITFRVNSQDTPEAGKAVLDGVSVIGGREWDHFLKNCHYCHHEQSSQYAAIRAAYGYHCDRVVVRNGDRIVGGAQVLVQSTPLGKLAHIQRAPLAVDDDPQVLRQVVQKLEEMAIAKGYRSVRIDLFPHQTTAFKVLEEAGFVCSNLWSSEMDSVVVPLNYTDEELLAGMHKKVAYEVRRARNKGALVLTNSENAVDEFYELHQATASYQKFPIFSQEYFVYLWRTFGQTGMVQPFIAYHNNRPLAALFNVIVGDHMYFGWGGMRRDSDAKKIRVNYLLHMTAIAWARQHGCTRYDFAGTQPFKQWFAVKIVQWPHALRKIYGPAATWRWNMMNMSNNSPFIKRLVQKASRELGLSQRMPV